MANIAITPQTATRSGVAPSYTVLNNTDTFLAPNGPSTILHFKYGGAGTAIITLITPATVAGLAVTDPQVIIGAGLERLVAFQPRAAFSDTAGRLSFTTNAATGLSVGVFQAP